MANKVRVHGKAQNRTALGIVNAYVVMYPHATLDDLRKAFPNELNPDKGPAELFLPLDEALKFNTKMSLYFAKPDEVITLADGSKVAFRQNDEGVTLVLGDRPASVDFIVELTVR